MPIDVIMPKLGESITEGTILEWKKTLGDKIDKDETLLEISTDKVDSEVPSPTQGKIIEILYKVNAVVAVGEVIARIGSNKDKIVKSQSNPTKTDTKEKTKNRSKKLESQKSKIEESEDISSNRKRFYSHLVKSIAKKERISMSELDSIKGSGASGRVNKYDILEYLKHRGTTDSQIGYNEFKEQSYPLEDKIEPMDHVRKIIANHMVSSRNTSVHVYSTSEVDITSIVSYKNENKEAFASRYKTLLTYTPFFIDSIIKAIHDFPLLNASVDGDNIKFNQHINIGVAVALPDDNLIVPVIKRSEEFNFLGLTRSTSDLAARARENSLAPEDVKDSTFTITNPGIFGSLFGMGIINQPNVGLLSVGSIHKRPVVKETEYGDVVVIRSMVYLTLAYDHRLVDGAYGTRFLTRIKQLLENFSSEDIKI